MLPNLAMGFSPVTEVKDIENLWSNPTVIHAATLKPTIQTRKDKLHWKRNNAESGREKYNNFDDAKNTTLSERAAVLEASRCLKCADAPCTKGCPTQIDVKSFIQCIQSKNFYGAAKQILTDNAVGLSCGMVCPVSELCTSGCNLVASEEGPININGLQHFAVQRFMEMRIPQIRDPNQEIADPTKKIAIIGAGPAGLSCANFLGRLGYEEIEVFEKSNVPGGLSTHEIPQFRLPYQAVAFEARLCRDLGVKFQYNKELGRDFILKDLMIKYDAIFISCGMYKSKGIVAFQNLSAANKVWSSKDFLPIVSHHSKGICGTTCGAQCPHGLPDIGLHAVVLGGGDTAFDCATSAFRCGAERVTIIFRKSWSDMRAVPEERELAMRELCDFIPNARPKCVHLDFNRKVESLELIRTEKDSSGNYQEDGDTYKLKCSSIITAFGCELDDTLKSAINSVLKINSKTNMIELENDGSDRFSLMNGLPLQAAGCPKVFVGGDMVGSNLTVEAANDGKIASWSIHKYLSNSESTVPRLPAFLTPVDLVDISVEMCGIRFPNPFGLASAPCSGSGSMIRRAFEQGWGFAVTKTFTLDRYAVTNVSPRIVRGTLNHRFGPAQNSFLNIELISEKTACYWVRAMKELKTDFPDRPIIASIMAPLNKEDWEEITRVALMATPDALELNLSCPHGMGEVGMGLACGTEEKMVEDITKWVKSIAKHVPVFPKLTPNVTEIANIAMAAERGGADGVTAINTLSGIMDMNNRGEPWPHIGYNDMFTTRGGISGDANRPLGLRACSMIKTYCPNLAIMGSGGASSAETTLQYLRLGASVVQICSSIQNQDYTVIEDYITGLKALLFMSGRTDLKKWDGQTPCPVKYDTTAISLLPHFGKYQYQRVAMRREQVLSEKQAYYGPTVVSHSSLEATEPILELVQAPSVNSIINKTATRIRNHQDLSRVEQVIANIHQDLCINCGKCYMSCNDSAYQAITFDPISHQAAIIPQSCTGCGLCQAVCPIPNCIDFIPRPVDIDYTLNRSM